MNERAKKAIERRMKRRMGMSRAALDKMHMANEADQWWAICHVCGKRIEGPRETVLKGCTCNG